MIPPQEWRKDAEKERSVSNAYSQPVIRSSLTFDFRHTSLGGYADPHTPCPGLDFSPTGVQEFTQFLAEDEADMSPQRTASRFSNPSHTSSDRTDTSSTGVHEFARLQDTLYNSRLSGRSYKDYHMRVDDMQRCQNCYGSTKEDDKAVAAAIVSILGPESRSGELLLRAIKLRTHF